MHMYEQGLGRNAVGNVVIWTMPWFPAYLWTLPMLHCNVWRFPWTVALQGGVHVCLRRVQAGAIMGAMREHGVDHYCAAPIVNSLIINTDPRRAMTSRRRCEAWWPAPRRRRP